MSRGREPAARQLRNPPIALLFHGPVIDPRWLLALAGGLLQDDVHFRERVVEARAPGRAFVSGVDLVDVDGDGDLDAFLAQSSEARLGATDMLLLNTGGTLEPAPPTLLSRRPGATRDSAWGDFDGDGEPDVVLLIAGEEEPAPRLCLSETGARLEWREVALRQGAMLGGGTRCVAADWDRDGALDLLVMGAEGARQLRNDGHGGWDEVAIDRLDAQSAFDRVGRADVLAAGDLDADGDLDVIASASMSGTLLRLANDGGRLVERPRLSFPEAFDAMSLCLGDWDGDGDLDLVVVHAAAPALDHGAARRGDRSASPSARRPPTRSRSCG